MSIMLINGQQPQSEWGLRFPAEALGDMGFCSAEISGTSPGVSMMLVQGALQDFNASWQVLVLNPKATSNSILL